MGGYRVPRYRKRRGWKSQPRSALGPQSVITTLQLSSPPEVPARLEMLVLVPRAVGKAKSTASRLWDIPGLSEAEGHLSGCGDNIGATPATPAALGRRALQGKPGGFSGTERERGEPVGTRRATGRHYSGRPWGGGNPGRMWETIPGRSGLSEEGLFVCRGRGRYLRGTRRALLRGSGSDIRPDPARGHPGPLEGAGAAAAALPGGAVAGRCPNCTAMQRSLSRGNLWQCSISGQGKP